MSPYENAAAAAVVLALLSGASSSAPRVKRIVLAPVTTTVAAPQPDALSAPCPIGTLPDGAACIPFEGARDDVGGDELTARTNEHHDRRGRLRTYDIVPRLPERTADYDRYAYPIPPPPGGHFAISGFDLDRPDDEQRRGEHLSAVGHGGVDLMAPRGTAVTAQPLEHQEGDAEILYVGELFGTTVATLNVVREGGRLRDYVVLHGHLDSSEKGLAKGHKVTAGDILGYVGDTGSEGVVHLHLEVRRARDGVDLRGTNGVVFRDNDRTVPVDPRNVLPLR